MKPVFAQFDCHGGKKSSFPLPLSCIRMRPLSSENSKNNGNKCFVQDFHLSGSSTVQMTIKKKMAHS